MLEIVILLLAASVFISIIEHSRCWYRPVA